MIIYKFYAEFLIHFVYQTARLRMAKILFLITTRSHMTKGQHCCVWNKLILINSPPCYLRTQVF